MGMGMSNEQVLEVGRSIIEEFRANGGGCGGPFEGNPTVREIPIFTLVRTSE